MWLGGEFDLESRRSVFSRTPKQELTTSPKHLQIWYHADFKGGGVFYDITHLTYCTSTTVPGI